ncbi:unnamed protein product [Rotaria socialis]
MAHLLGSKTCIDSLRVDIDDIQTVICEIIGKTGSLKCHSWKFPDKLATDIDIKELLERYQHGKNELDNQVSHIVLFEIIIDRLLLVVHGSWHFLYEIQAKLLPNTIDSASTVNLQTSLSIGLVVKKYWNKLLHLFSILQQHETSRKRSNPTPSLPVRSKSTVASEKQCQTIETSFGPCSSCLKYQEYVQNSSESMINLCHLYNLPSSLAHHRCSTSTTCESFNDMSHWIDSQSKDFDRLSKHLEYLHSTLNKTKQDLDSSEYNSKQLNETNHHLQQIIHNEKESKKKLEELHEQKLIEIKKDNDQYQWNLNEQLKLLTTQKSNLEQRLKEITEESTSRGEQIEKLESSKIELKFLTEERIKSDDLIKTLEEDRIRLQTQLDVVKRDLEERNRDLHKERMRMENMIRHEENYQSKQKLLTNSYEELSKELESLKKKVSELECERDELQKRNQPSSDTNQVQSFLETNNHVLQEVTSLKSTIEQLQQQLQQMNEREKVLLQHHSSNGSSQHTSTSNNFLIDMQTQMRTNELRIDLLRKQNDSLKSSLEQIRVPNHHTTLPSVSEELRPEQTDHHSSYTHEPLPPKPKQSPLWLLNNEILEQQQQQTFTETKPPIAKIYMPRVTDSNYTSHRWIKSDQDVNIETLSQSNVHSADSRPPIPNHSRAPSIPSRLDHEMTMAKVQLITLNRPLSSNRTRPSSTTEHTRRDNSLPKSSRTFSSAKTQRSPTKAIHQCTTCNRTFDDKRNYDIHKLYCRT